MNRFWEKAEVVASYQERTGPYPAEAAILDLVLAARERLGRVLDVGVGTGRTTSYLQGRAETYLGIDLSHAMLTIAAERNPRAAFAVVDATDFGGLPDTMFDLVLFSHNGIDNLLSPAARASCLRAASRVCAPGGHFAYSSHNLRCWPALMSHVPGGINPIRSPRHFLRQAWTNLQHRHLNPDLPALSTAGFAVIKTWYLGGILPQAFVMPGDEPAALTAAGFEFVTAFDLNGKRIAARDLAETREAWVHFLARRPA